MVYAMPFRLTTLAAAAASLMLVPASAGAATHLIAPGETLSGIAAANGLSTQTLAAANGMPADAFVISGRSLTIPAPGTVSAAPAAATTTAAPAPLGGY